jgi:uncharacterized protein
MRSKLIHQAAGQRTFAVILKTGDEIMSCLKAFAEKEGLSTAQFSAIGALSRATLSYFDWDERRYIPIPVNEQVEVASLTGDVTLSHADHSRSIHIHLVVGRRDGSALAGHLLEGHVRPTLELVLTESPTYLRKSIDPTSGLPLIDLAS